MATNLNFKWGLYKNLPDTAQEGTVYITTDEQAMYVGLKKQVKNEQGETEEKVVPARIQGSVLYYDSVEQFTAETDPPYSTEVLYFFRTLGKGDKAAKNALMAYDGKNWKQINITKKDFDDHTTSISQLNTTVTKLSKDLDTLTTRVGTLEGKVDTLEGTVSGHTTNIQVLQELVGIGSGSSEGGTLSSKISALETAVSQAQTAITEKADKTYVDDKLDTKVDKTSYEEDKATFALKTELTSGLATKVDSTIYTEKVSELTNAINKKAEKTYVDSKLDEKVDSSTYTTDKATFALKADVATELATKVNQDDYNKKVSELTNTINGKAEKTYVDNKLDEKVDNSAYETDKATFALKSELTTKVDSTIYSQKVSELENKISGKASTADLNKAKEELTTEIGKKVNNSDYKVDKATFALKADVATELDKKVDNTTYNQKVSELTNAINALDAEKAKQSDVDAALAGKVDNSTYEVDKATFALKTDVATELATKVDSTIYTGKVSELTNAINEKAEKTYVDTALAGKVDNSDYEVDKATFALKTDVATELGKKVNNTTYNQKVSELTNAINLKANTTDLNKAKQDLQANLDAHIKAANALVYKGAIDSSHSLPKTDVKIGDMYAAASKYTYNGVVYAPGDLFIAEGTENESGVITNVTWNIIKTGYDSVLNPKLIINPSKNTLELQTYADSPIGTIELKGSGNLSVACVIDNENQKSSIVFENVWESFDPPLDN